MNISRVRTVRMLTLALAVVLAAGHAFASIPLKPLNGKKITINIGTKQHIYHLVTKAEPLNLEVAGPAKIDLVTRLLLPKGASGAYDYTIVATDQGKIVKTYKTSAGPSDATIENDDAVPGKSRKCTVNVPEGDHTLNFTLNAEKADRCALRFMLSGKENLQTALHGKSVRIEPLSYDRVAATVVAEKLITYYVSSKTKPVQLHVIGPTDVVVDARLNFDPSMVGKQTYVLNVIEGSKTLFAAPLKSTRAVSAYYQDWKEVVPGKLNRIRLTVPGGDHTYTFSLGDCLATSVSLKFSLPEKAVQNTSGDRP